MKYVGSGMCAHKAIPRHLFIVRKEFDIPMHILTNVFVRAHAVNGRLVKIDIMPKSVGQILSLFWAMFTICAEQYVALLSDQPLSF